MESIKLNNTIEIYIPNSRTIPQDAYYANDIQKLYIVSDGIGSYKNSEIASQLMTTFIPNLFRQRQWHKNGFIKSDLLQVIRSTAIELNRVGKNDSSLHNIATTLTLLAIHGEDYWIAQVGDSRAYLLRKKGFKQLTNDHSVAFEQYMAGAIKKNEIMSHPNQSILTRCFSAGKDFAICDIFQGKICRNDIFLLCSDGLTKEVTDREICRVLNQETELSEKARTLVETVSLQGGEDEATVILVQAY